MEKKPLRLTISFSKQHEDIFHYLNTQENTSKFVCELIQREMKNTTQGEKFEEKVYKILQQYLENEQIPLNTDKTRAKVSDSKSQLKDEEIDLLNDWFG